jgi:hypothetical protein
MGQVVMLTNYMFVIIALPEFAEALAGYVVLDVIQAVFYTQ